MRAVAPAVPDLPEHLTRFDPADWPLPARVESASVGGETAASRAHNRPITAWMQARQDWAAAHELQEHDLPGPRPRRRLFLS